MCDQVVDIAGNEVSPTKQAEATAARNQNSIGDRMAKKTLGETKLSRGASQWRLVKFFWGGAVAQQTISQTILHNKSNRQADPDPDPLPSVFLPTFSSQTDIGVKIVQS